MPHDKDHVLADVHQGGAEGGRSGDQGLGRGLGGLAPRPLGGARRRLPPRRRAARRAMARHAERRHDARPVEDGAPGRDRRRLRADRLLALQPLVHDADLRGAADLEPGRLEPDGVPAARGLRLRGLAVQLHRHRRQPHRRAGADGEHGRLEARLDGDALRVLHDAPLPGGRAPGRRDQPRLRLAARRSATPRSRAPTSPASTSPARRRSSRTCGRRSARTSRTTAAIRASSARPAARTSSSRTRRLTPRPSPPRSCAAPSSTRARSARRPRASTRPRACGLRSRSSSLSQVGELKYGDVSDFSNFMGAVIDASSFATQKEAIEEAKADAKSEVVVGGELRRLRGLLRRADGHRHRGPRLQAPARRALRPGRHDLRLPGRELGGDARADRPHGAVRAHGRDLRGRARGGGSRPPTCSATRPGTST